jgi:hypothetical protein
MYACARVLRSFVPLGDVPAATQDDGDDDDDDTERGADDARDDDDENVGRDDGVRLTLVSCVLVRVYKVKGQTNSGYLY